MGKKVQQNQPFVSDQASLDGLALRSKKLDRYAEPGYGTNHDTKFGHIRQRVCKRDSGSLRGTDEAHGQRQEIAGLVEAAGEVSP